MKYSRDQIKEVLQTATAFRLFHCTPVANLSSIIRDRNIYSLGTLWGIHPATRNNIRTTSPHPSASMGFVDYIFLSKVNRLSRGLSPIFGQVCFQIVPDVLVDKESFVYPFNTGYDWNRQHTQSKKKSDASTLERCIASQFVTDEFLVRRRINIEEYIEKVYCTNSVGTQVSQIMTENNWNIDIEYIADPVPNAGENVRPINAPTRPTYDINLVGKGRVTRDHLFFNSDNNNLVFHDQTSNCLAEFHIDGDRLLDPFDRHYELGTIARAAAETA